MSDFPNYFNFGNVILIKSHTHPAASQKEVELGLWDLVPILSPFLPSRMSSSAENSWKITEQDNPAVPKKEPIGIHIQAKQVRPGPHTNLSPEHHER